MIAPTIELPNRPPSFPSMLPSIFLADHKLCTEDRTSESTVVGDHTGVMHMPPPQCEMRWRGEERRAAGRREERAKIEASKQGREELRGKNLTPSIHPYTQAISS